MAGRSWDNLSPKYRERLSRAGVTKRQYESGANLSKARGHGQTPEHPREAHRKPEKYSDYISRRTARQTPEDEAYELNEARDNAYRNIVGRLGNYFKFDINTVRVNVYGGEKPDGSISEGMSLPQAAWSAKADAEELRSRGESQYRGNPWWYH
jgi:hypothetical protein